MLLPEAYNKLQMIWKGPFIVIENYRIQTGKKETILHINLLKRYVNHDDQSTQTYFVIAMVLMEGEDEGNISVTGRVPSCPLWMYKIVKDVKINDALTDEQKRELTELLQVFSSTLTDRLGLNDLIEFSLKLIDSKPIHLKLYPLPHAKVEDVRGENKTNARSRGHREDCIWVTHSID